MEHSLKFELVKNYYNNGRWSKKAVRKAVESKWITVEEYEEIINEQY